MKVLIQKSLPALTLAIFKNFNCAVKATMEHIPPTLCHVGVRIGPAVLQADGAEAALTSAC